ncbi:MAG: hypothetical protein BMS9Abin08_1136 [Gammaproteobacteria bacterium]|nr:MAG: hypothetical protein BMS9Abin08_1136 [Gammaproteobacteria bacterium]
MKKFQSNFVRQGAEFLLAAIIVTHVPDSLATPLNIDFFDSLVASPISPGSSYGGAAGQVGTWNALPGKDGVYGAGHAAPTIVDLAGNSLLGVFVDLAGADLLINPQTQPSLLSGNDAALVNDGFVTKDNLTPWVLQISGIANGLYDVYVYAIPTISTSAWTFSSGVTTQIELIGSSNNTNLTQGLNYIVAQTMVTGNVLILQSGTTTTGTAGSGLAGLQLDFISPVPIPAALPLFLSALTGLGFIGWRGKRLAGS